MIRAKFDIKSWLWLPLLIILIFILFYPFMTQYDGIYLYFDDGLNQVFQFYQQMWENVRINHVFSSWDWSNFMGANYLAR